MKQSVQLTYEAREGEVTVTASKEGAEAAARAVARELVHPARDRDDVMAAINEMMAALDRKENADDEENQ